MIAKVHSYETFGTVDGPGIRFVLFLKGCPLRCLYCHNPDTWEMTNYKEVDSLEILNEVLKYKSYYSDTGGVTISGGEPLMQLDFLIVFCKLLKENGMHVALDTSGFNFSENDSRYLELIKYVDLFLLDIKHIDDLEHIKLTKVSNKSCLKFATFLSEHNKTMWIRHVLVPGYTLNEKYLNQLKNFIDTLKTVEKVEVLKYHTMGKYKYDQLNLKYELEGVLPPTNEEYQMAKDILNITR